MAKTATKEKPKAPSAKASAKGSTSLAPRKTTAVSAEAASARMFDDAQAKPGHGFETRDLAIPFITILQKLSPEISKKADEYIEGAEEGMIYNPATGKLYPGEEGINVIPIRYMRRWTQWKLRSKGGGFIKDWGGDESCMEDTTQDEDGRFIVNGKKDEQIVESGDYFVYVIDPETGEVDQGIISMTSSNWKCAKSLNSLINTWKEPRPDGKGVFNPKMFARSYVLTSTPMSNDKGEWMAWKVKVGEKTFDLTNGADLYDSAAAFSETIESGNFKIAQPRAELQAGADVGDKGKKF